MNAPLPAALLDTNVVLDVLLARAPFAAAANACMLHVEDGRLRGYLGATTVTTLDYLLANALDAKTSRQHLARMLDLFEVAGVNRAVLAAALGSNQKDFEDAVLVEAARAAGVPNIITRNAKDFVGCGLAVFTPVEWLAGGAIAPVR